jgi:exodeoxyribonuclease-5
MACRLSSSTIRYPDRPDLLSFFSVAVASRILSVETMEFSPATGRCAAGSGALAEGAAGRRFSGCSAMPAPARRRWRAISPSMSTGRCNSPPSPARPAQVLRSKGATNARTIHSLIYRPRGEEAVSDETTGKTSMSPTFSLNRQSPIAKAALVVIDECSMVDEQLGRDLLSFGTPILVLGDPGQLPPISGGGFFTEHEPDYPADRDPPAGARQPDHPAGA